MRFPRATHLALFHDDPAVLGQWCTRIERYFEGRRLRLHPRKTIILTTAEAAPFLGLVLMPGGWRRLPEENVGRFRNRLRGLRDRWLANSVKREEIDAKIVAWIGHANHADTWRLRRAIFRGGRFDPVRCLGE